MTTPRSVRSEVENFLDYLLQKDLALYCNPVVQYGGQIVWPLPSDRPEFLLSRGAHTMGEYAHWLTHSMYSALMVDGSLLQISYQVDGGQVTGHRLAWVPPPFDFAPDLVESDLILELLEAYNDDETEEVQLRSPIRFDFDPEAASELHPASHLTINGPSCRVACVGPLRLGRFVEFVFTHFYRDIWDDHEYLRTMPKTPYDRYAPVDPGTSGMHLAWAS
jgi:hypothetical protein